jgi:elongation of very long chain fatty acids protein 6
MNYAVHAVMYFYYFLMAVHRKPKWFKPVWITVAQISQMFLGCVVTGMGVYLLLIEKPDGCSLTGPNILPSIVMYGSYLILFLQFFVKRYALRPAKKKTV